MLKNRQLGFNPERLTRQLVPRGTSLSLDSKGNVIPMANPKKSVKVSQFSEAGVETQDARIVAIVAELQKECDKSSKVIGLSLHEFQGSKELAFILIPIEMWRKARLGGGEIACKVVVKGGDETRSSYYSRIETTGFAREIEGEETE